VAILPPWVTHSDMGEVGDSRRLSNASTGATGADDPAANALRSNLSEVRCAAFTLRRRMSKTKHHIDADRMGSRAELYNSSVVCGPASSCKPSANHQRCPRSQFDHDFDNHILHFLKHIRGRWSW
jgi:hypothetical protein